MVENCDINSRLKMLSRLRHSKLLEMPVISIQAVSLLFLFSVSLFGLGVTPSQALRLCLVSNQAGSALL